MESEDVHNVASASDEQLEDLDAGSGSKIQKQGLVGHKEIQKIRSHECVDVDRGQKRKAAQNKKHEYLFHNGFSFSQLNISIGRLQ